MGKGGKKRNWGSEGMEKGEGGGGGGGWGGETWGSYTGAPQTSATHSHHMNLPKMHDWIYLILSPQYKCLFHGWHMLSHKSVSQAAWLRGRRKKTQTQTTHKPATFHHDVWKTIEGWKAALCGGYIHQSLPAAHGHPRGRSTVLRPSPVSGPRFVRT